MFSLGVKNYGEVGQMPEDLIERLKARARRYEARSPERTLLIEAAEQLQTAQQRKTAIAALHVTIEAVERALGAPLLPWQRKRLEARQAPPAAGVA